MINRFTVFIYFFLTCLPLTAINAKMVEYYEDAYAQQASPELADMVAKIADTVGFTQDYQVIVPKKAGLQINPINKMISYGFNAQTKNPLMIINPEWFSTLSQDQQNFLIARSFIALQKSNGQTLPKLFTPLWVIVFLALGVLAFFILKKKYMIGKPTWMIVLATAIPFLIVDTVLGPVHDKIKLNIARRFDAHIAQTALEKLGQDKQTAIDTFARMDELVKKELAEGDTFWKAYETIFSDIAARLK